uniref:C2H2-type domain-containing protein n=1 Tax=Lotus japonicus TaxID=34305 RepID=I3SKS1_LOTJA|nr:unknown [Lotus japonicus]
MSFMDSPEPVSSVSDTSPDEDVAMCLMMLSRDSWRISNNVDVNVVVVVKEEEEMKSEGFPEINFRKVRGKHQCENCGKKFRSSGALGSHKSICVDDDEEVSDDKIFQCPFCEKVFGSGQALGGHKRSHLYPSSSSTASGFKQTFFDLNLPASPEEDDDLSVVSDA